MKISAVALVFAFVATPAAASPLHDCGLGKNDCRAMVGKRLWIVAPASNPNAVEFSNDPHDWNNTTRLKNGSSFLVNNVVPGKYSGYEFQATLQDGRKGYVPGSSWMFLSETDPVADARKREAEAVARQQECERRGPPKIGMTTEQLFESCWGRPIRVVKKTTSIGVEQNLIYSRGHVVKMTDGKISEIIETQ